VVEIGPDPYLQPCDPDLSRFLPGHHFEYRFLHKATASAEVAELAREGFDVFINMCDGAPDEHVPGVGVVETLEKLGLPFTGASSEFYAASRERLKEVCRELALPTPAYAFASDLAAAERAADELRFPLIVKHHDSYNSIGLGPQSRVEDRSALRAEAGRMLDQFARVLIEEFIEGEELSALILEDPDAADAPLVLTPMRVGLPPGESFLHDRFMGSARPGLAWVPVRDEVLRSRIGDIVRPLFLGLRATGYGRCDLRMSPEGELFILEMNANCELFAVPGTYDHPSTADAILLNDPLGPAGFLSHIIRTALARHGRGNAA
jgi:D-alanine-D-alanine ligase